jgi:predicted transcriptional regulator
MISTQIIDYIRANPNQRSEQIAQALNLIHGTVQITLIRYFKAGKISRKKVNDDKWVCGPRSVYVYFIG